MIGHRGACGYAPENTLASMRKAAELGARVVEFDVKLTADDVPILMHDDMLDRTTDGAGAVRRATLAEISALDAGSWFGAAFRGEPVPGLDAVLELLDLHGMTAIVEIKPCPGRESETGRVVAARLSGVPGCVASSFSVEALIAARAECADLATALLLPRLVPAWQAHVERVGARALHLGDRGLDAAAVASATTAGCPVSVFTVAEPERAAELYSWGVDAVFTDFPDRLLPVARSAK